MSRKQTDVTIIDIYNVFQCHGLSSEYPLGRRVMTGQYEKGDMMLYLHKGSVLTLVKSELNISISVVFYCSIKGEIRCES